MERPTGSVATIAAYLGQVYSGQFSKVIVPVSEVRHVVHVLPVLFVVLIVSRVDGKHRLMFGLQSRFSLRVRGFYHPCEALLHRRI